MVLAISKLLVLWAAVSLTVVAQQCSELMAGKHAGTSHAGGDSIYLYLDESDDRPPVLSGGLPTQLRLFFSDAGVDTALSELIWQVAELTADRLVKLELVPSRRSQPARDVIRSSGEVASPGTWAIQPQSGDQPQILTGAIDSGSCGGDNKIFIYTADLPPATWKGQATELRLSFADPAVDQSFNNRKWRVVEVDEGISAVKLEGIGLTSYASEAHLYAERAKQGAWFLMEPRRRRADAQTQAAQAALETAKVGTAAKAKAAAVEAAAAAAAAASEAEAEAEAAEAAEAAEVAEAAEAAEAAAAAAAAAARHEERVRFLHTAVAASDWKVVEHLAL
jgi:hypothetical protein